MVTGYIILGQKSAIKNELHVKLWMINNQFSRRNLPTETRLALAYRYKEFEAEMAKERKLANLKQFLEAKNAETEVSQLTDSLPVGSREDTTKGKTLDIIAQKAGVSRSTAEQYDAIQRKGTEEQKAERLEKKKAIEWLRGFPALQKGFCTYSLQNGACFSSFSLLFLLL